MNDYRAALSERDGYDMDSLGWRLSQKKAEAIVAAMVANGNRQMVQEVMDEVYILNDCGMDFDDEAIQHDLWLLESNGYEAEAQELRELDWE